MEKVRVIATGLRICRWYLILFHLAFLAYVTFVFLVLSREEEAIITYCIHARDNEPYDFLWDAQTRCRINWSFFYGEIFPVLAALYGVFSGPVWIARHLLVKMFAPHRDRAAPAKSYEK